MFAGHFAPAIVAAAHPKAPSLPILFVGAQLVDWAFFGFVLTGAEHMRIVPGHTVINPFDLYDMPLTHSLAGSLAWAAGFGMLIWMWRRDLVTAAIGAVVVLSHWFFDLLVHSRDLTIAGAPPKLGFGLWNYPAIEMPLEVALVVGSIAFLAYRRRNFSVALLTLGILLLGLQAVDWLGAKPAAADAAMVLLAWAGFAVATLAAWWAGGSLKATGPSAD